MNLANQIRFMILENGSEEVRKLLIDHRQLKTVKLVKKLQHIKASKLASLENLSIQNASAKLARLEKAGYLIKSQVVAKNGGIEYVYRFNSELES